MSKKNVLFISWQGGLGHITRDLAIAKELHKQYPEIELSWLAHPPASRLLKEAGETILPESLLSADYNEIGIKVLGDFKLNIAKYAQLGKKAWARNAELFKQVAAKHHFDLVIGDESYEVLDAMMYQNFALECRFVMIHDFLGVVAMTKNPLETLIVYLRNRKRYRSLPGIPPSRITHFFVGEPEDVPDRKFGFLLPNKRELAEKHFLFLGHIIRFDPAEYADKAKIRAKLGYGEEPLVICATGGLGAGKEMIELCGKAYPLIKKAVPNLRMIAVCGELYGGKPPALPDGVKLKMFIPDLFEHYAACDLAVVVGGGTTATELTTLRRPFIYFPLENQFDQQLYIADRLTRIGAGIRMRYFQTTPESLAETILAHIGKEVAWPSIAADGAKKAASLVGQFLYETSTSTK